MRRRQSAEPGLRQNGGRLRAQRLRLGAAVISLPQRDLAAHHVYTLPDGFGKEQAMDEVDVYMSAFAGSNSGGPGWMPSIDGLVLMLQDLIINRLPLMMIVNHVAQKRRHAGGAYLRAHRLLSFLT